MSRPDELLNDWEPETRSLVRALRAAGFTLVEVDNGDEEPMKITSETTEKKIIDELTACDEARLYVKNPAGKRLGLFLVFGNSPGELVCDYHCDPLLDTVTRAESDKWDGRKQPTILASVKYPHHAKL